MEVTRSSPHLFLEKGEGFVPASGDSGVEWVGKLSILRAGDYRFFVASGTLWINGSEVDSETIRLEARLHDFKLKNSGGTGTSRVFVEWEGPDFLREPIPSRLFSHEPDREEREEGADGRALFEDLGCSNCHTSDSPSIQNRPAPQLTGLGGRRKRPWIRHWLDRPAHFRNWATMPEMLSDSERADVAAFLSAQLSDQIQEPTVKGIHVERGRTTFQSFGCAACHGAELPLVGLGSKMTTGHLQQYLLDPIKYTPDGRMPSFHLDENEALELAAYLALSRNEAFESPTSDGSAERGRELVESSGCLSCHRLNGLVQANEAPALLELSEADGCLAETVPPGLPRYRLDHGQRAALQRFVRGYRSAPDVVAAPTFDLPRRLAQLRCGTCHEFNGEAPTGSLAEPAPPLTGVGAKLRRQWLERTIGSETRALDWQELRMPSFGAEHAIWLADALGKASGVDPRAQDRGHPGGDRHQGLDRLGVDGTSGGMGCIGCHGWGGFPALGENGPNLYEAGERLRLEWFKRWMRDPARILAGTSMPNYFAGRETPESLDAIGDFWAAFRSAPDLPPPFGFRAADAIPGGEARPVPRGRAIVIRWDMPEATPASIAVGLPGGLSYCFDAGESRLRYAWSGGFVNMTRTLLAKKNRDTNLTETAEIVGEIFFREGPYPIRVGDRNRIPQRKFRGYRLLDSIPEFHYEVDGVSVYERIDRTDNGLLRRFRIENVDEPMWFVPAEAEGVEIRSSLGGFDIPTGSQVSFEVSVVKKQN